MPGIVGGYPSDVSLRYLVGGASSPSVTPRKTLVNDGMRGQLVDGEWTVARSTAARRDRRRGDPGAVHDVAGGRNVVGRVVVLHTPDGAGCVSGGRKVQRIPSRYELRTASSEGNTSHGLQEKASFRASSALRTVFHSYCGFLCEEIRSFHAAADPGFYVPANADQRASRWRRACRRGNCRRRGRRIGSHRSEVVQQVRNLR